MTKKQRVIALVQAAIAQLGSGQKVADYLGVTAQAVTNWKAGRDAPRWDHLMALQDLVKRAACVLIALAGLTQAPDGGANGTHSTPPESARQSLHCAIIRFASRIPYSGLIRLLKALCMGVVGIFHPADTPPERSPAAI